MIRRRPSFPLLAALAVAVLAAAALALATPPAQAVTNCTPTASWGTNRADLASQVVSLINQYRAGKGLSQLAVSSTLTASSTWKSLHMAGNGYFAHDDPAPPVARGAYQRAKDCGFSGHDLGREHRLRVPHGAVGRERLAGLRRSQGEHREPELHLDRRRRGRNARTASSTGRRTSATTSPAAPLRRPRRRRATRRSQASCPGSPPARSARPRRS